MRIRDSNPSFMNGVPELLILRLLQDGEMYGYQIVQAIRRRTGKVVTVGEGVVYPVLHHLERNGAVKAVHRTVNSRSRIYYTATSLGAHRLAEQSRVWSDLAGAIQAMLNGGSHGAAVR